MLYIIKRYCFFDIIDKYIFVCVNNLSILVYLWINGTRKKRLQHIKRND
jgi:hypothetical protein